MKALYYDGTLTYRDDMPMPERKKGEALIKVIQAGICRTDLEIVKGYMDFTGIPGHEFVGEVMEADDQSLVGCRVAGEINAGCGDCPACRMDNHKHCPARTVLGIKGRNGAFAEYLTLPEVNLFIVPDSIEDDEAVFIEPLAAAFRVAEQIRVHSNDVLVLGDGKLGLLIAQTLAFLGADLTLCGRHPEKMALISRSMATTVTPDRLKPGRLYSVVVDVTGNREGLTEAFNRVAPKGTLVLKTTVKEPDSIDMTRIVIDEITVIGSRCGPFEHALGLLEYRAVQVTPLIQARFPLERGLEAFEAAGKPGALKVLLS